MKKVPNILNLIQSQRDGNSSVVFKPAGDPSAPPSEEFLWAKQIREELLALLGRRDLVFEDAWTKTLQRYPKPPPPEGQESQFNETELKDVFKLIWDAAIEQANPK